MYEIGALAALDDLFEGTFHAGKFDLIVGTSAGASVGAIVASGVSPRRLMRAMLDPDDDFFGLRRHDVYRLDVRAMLGAVRDIAKIVMVHMGKGARGRFSAPELGKDLEDALPSGVFSLEHYEAFLTRFFQRHSLPTRFDDFPLELYITANDLDSGHRIVFGERGWRDISVPRAIAASSAIPIFFEPVRINDRDFVDGGAGKVAHTDVAIRHGARLIVVVNPMVPVRNVPSEHELPTPLRGATRLRDKGLLTVWDQAARMNTKTKLHQGLRRWRSERPDVTVLLLEPDERESALFFANAMNFEVRQRMLRYGYECTVRQIRERSDELVSSFGRCGVDFDPARLRRDPWRLHD